MFKRTSKEADVRGLDSHLTKVQDFPQASP